jgi:hypothetical protein
MKTCFKCKTAKPITEFYVHPQMADGRLGKCKECAKADVRKNYESNLVYYREYDKQRYRDDQKRQKQYAGLYARRTPRQAKAHYTLGNAVRSGKVTRPDGCWHCGSTQNIEAHHVHYDLPLDVVWLCRSCHVKAHKQTVTA